jgi:hypothetical protein
LVTLEGGEGVTGEEEGGRLETCEGVREEEDEREKGGLNTLSSEGRGRRRDACTSVSPNADLNVINRAHLLDITRESKINKPAATSGVPNMEILHENEKTS